jgi:hypothetical protein
MMYYVHLCWIGWNRHIFRKIYFLYKRLQSIVVQFDTEYPKEEGSQTTVTEVSFSLDIHHVDS